MQQGREWELLVARLEQLLAGSAFRVTSPDNIRSPLTGNIVKVDVTVRGRVGSQDVLVAFECRDRDGRAGVDWIQQLLARKADIGASEFIAVSRDGFTKDAVREAAAHGIPLRTLERATDKELADFVLGLRLESLIPHYEAKLVDYSGLRIRPFGVDLGSWPEFTPQHLQGILDAADTPSLVDSVTGGLVSIADMIRQADWAAAFAEGVFEGTRTYTAEVTSEYIDQFGHAHPRYRYWLDRGHGVDMSGFTFTGQVWWRSEPVLMSQAMRYSESERTLVTVAEFDLAPHGIPHTLQVFMGGE